MIKYLIQDLFSNKYIRIALLVFFLLIIFSISFQNRISIANTLDNFLGRPQFDNPYNWNSPFAFEENSERAFQNYEKGIKELIDLAADVYNQENYDSEHIWKSKFSFQKRWSSMLKNNDFTLIFYLLTDLKRFCRNSFYYETPRDRWDRENILTKRYTKENHSKNPFDYAITEKNVNSIRKKILEIDRNYIFYSLQYKPDFYAAYTLQEDLYFHICKKNTPYSWWEKSVSYIEYKHKKKLYLHDQKKYNHFSSYEFYEKLFQYLKNDKNYLFYLKNLFFRQKYNIKEIEAREKKAYSIFILSGKKEDLNEYFKILREKIRVSSVDSAKKIHDEIYKIQYQNIEYEYQYLAALAESAFYAHEYEKSRKYIQIIKNQKLYKTNHQHTDIYRLDLILNLKGY